MVAREKTTEPLTLRDTLPDTHICKIFVCISGLWIGHVQLFSRLPRRGAVVTTCNCAETAGDQDRGGKDFLPDVGTKAKITKEVMWRLVGSFGVVHAEGRANGRLMTCLRFRMV